RAFHVTGVQTCALPICFGLGSISQAMQLPSDLGHNALFSGTFHTLAVLLTAEGVLRRSGRKLGLAVDAVVFVGVISLLWYFFYRSEERRVAYECTACVE